jgi:hypothetical protein
MPKVISVYDCSGKLMHRAIVQNNSMNLHKDFGLSNGLYFVRINAMGGSEKYRENPSLKVD